MRKILLFSMIIALSLPVFGRLEVVNKVPEGHAQSLWQNTIILGDFDIEEIYDKVEREQRYEYVARRRGFSFTVQITPIGEPEPKLLKINVPEGCRIRMLGNYILCIGGVLLKESELVWSIQPFTTETLTHTTITFESDPTDN